MLRRSTASYSVLQPIRNMTERKSSPEQSFKLRLSGSAKIDFKVSETTFLRLFLALTIVLVGWMTAHPLSVEATMLSVLGTQLVV